MPLMIAVDATHPDAGEIRRAAEVIRGGGIVAMPTDTFYGLAVDARDSCAVARLFEIKGRPASAALLVVAADLAQARTQAGRLTPIGERLAARFWPGPLTIVIDAHREIATGVRAADGSVAVRVPAHAAARALARAVGAPLTATSANRSGEAPAADALGDDVDAVVDAGSVPGGEASTIVDARGDAPRLVRAGAVAWAAVLESLG